MNLVIISLLLSIFNICDANVTHHVYVSYFNDTTQPNGCMNTNPDARNTSRCSTLQEALDFVTGFISGDHMLFIIELDNSQTHLITKPMFTFHSVYISSVFTDVAAAATVKCDFDAESYKQTGQLHALYFNESDLVMFSNVLMSDCSLPIRMYRSKQVILEHSHFKYFTEAVFDVHNCQQVIVHNCSFTNNFGTGIINQPYRGNTGALSITYNYLPRDNTTSNPSVNVTNCNFTNNSATRTLSSDQTFGIGVLTGRGGGMAVFVREEHFNITAWISHCRYFQNYAEAYAGGMYVLFNGFGSHQATVEDCVFEGNIAEEGGAGLVLVGVGNALNAPHSYLVRNCEFNRNKGSYGGGVYYSINLGGGATHIAIFENSTFTGNILINNTESFGAAIAVDIAEDFEAKQAFHTNIISNCTFQENIGENSIVSIGFQIFKFTGNNKFHHNTGLALRIVGTVVTLSDTMEFINNSALDGAALTLLSLSQIRLDDNLQLLFQKNSGRFGSSLLVSSIPAAGVFEEIVFNPQCFMLLNSNPLLPPSEWGKSGINITFTGNTALFGSAVYATSLTQCSWVVNGITKSFDILYFPKWPIFTIKDDNRNDAFINPYNQEHSIVTNSVELDLPDNNDMIAAWPGQTMNMSLQAIDQFGNPTGALSRFFYVSNSETQNTEELFIVPNTVLITKEKAVSGFRYYTNADTNDTKYINGDIVIEHFGVSYTSDEGDSSFIHINGRSCIGGYHQKVSTNRLRCECNTDRDYIILCKEDQDSVIIKSGQWALRYSNQSGSLFFHVCPSGYCRCFLNATEGSSSCVSMFTNSNPDSQCTCNRKGILCGECKNDTTVTVLSNQCTSCGHVNVLLIPSLVIVVISVLGILVFIDKPMFQLGYTFLFYLQIVPLATLHFPVTFSTVGKYLMYIGSALSLYYPYDFCIHNNITTVGLYGLRLIPGTLVLVLIPVMILLRYIVSKCSAKSHFYTFNGHGVWSVMLLVYTQTLYASINVLHCPLIPEQNGSHIARWYWNGSMECFTDKHLPLAIYAIVWIIISISLIVIALLLSLNKSEHRLLRFTILSNLSESMKRPFQKHLGFWFAIELLRRMLAVILISTLPDNSICILLLLMILVLLYGYFQPYKNTITNLMEVSILVIFLVLLMLRIDPFFNDVLETINTNENSSNSIPSCLPNEKTAVIPLVIILSVMYYTPVLIGFVCFSVWIVKYVRRKYIQFQKPKEYRSTNFEYDLSASFQEFINSQSRRSRTFLSTELDTPLIQ